MTKIHIEFSTFIDAISSMLICNGNYVQFFKRIEEAQYNILKEDDLALLKTIIDSNNAAPSINLSHLKANFPHLTSQSYSAVSMTNNEEENTRMADEEFNHRLLFFVISELMLPFLSKEITSKNMNNEIVCKKTFHKSVTGSHRYLILNT